ncbi:MarR family winged helix-turn-helix transcriptional regulator [Pediococcus parvulus]|uniref:MarR family winged helix-turn-helix transcriptional regulator n=1 Tax=Pediococcus parvulus TaxID=54062 RepID=UPI0021A32327|nr:MarR family transcriptional regulator [Pediococcus parvulus]MCT3031978.1 MarR family transcriptional regulator [Pediococcus parvulus]
MKDLCKAYVGNNIKMVHNKIDTLFTKETNKLFSGLTNTQYLVLIYLGEENDKCALQKEIETKFELSHPTTVGIIKRLSVQNLVVTRPYEKNKRQKEVMITSKGMSLLTSIKNGPRSILNKVDNDALAGFSEEEKNQLNNYLYRINDNLNEF